MPGYHGQPKFLRNALIAALLDGTVRSQLKIPAPPKRHPCLPPSNPVSRAPHARQPRFPPMAYPEGHQRVRHRLMVTEASFSASIRHGEEWANRLKTGNIGSALGSRNKTASASFS